MVKQDVVGSFVIPVPEGLQLEDCEALEASRGHSVQAWTVEHNPASKRQIKGAGGAAHC